MNLCMLLFCLPFPGSSSTLYKDRLFIAMWVSPMENACVVFSFNTEIESECLWSSVPFWCCLVHGMISTLSLLESTNDVFLFRYVSQRCLHGTAREWIQWSNLWIQFLRIKKFGFRGHRVVLIHLRSQLIKWRGFIRRTTLALTSKLHLQGRNHRKSGGTPAPAL